MQHGSRLLYQPLGSTHIHRLSMSYVPVDKDNEREPALSPKQAVCAGHSGYSTPLSSLIYLSFPFIARNWCSIFAHHKGLPHISSFANANSIIFAMPARGDAWKGDNSRGRVSTGDRSRFPTTVSRETPSWTVYSGQTHWQQRNELHSRPPSPPLGPVLMTLNERDLGTSPDLKEPLAKITECKYVASYNWLNRNEPTILVSGKPVFSFRSRNREYKE